MPISNLKNSWPIHFHHSCQRYFNLNMCASFVTRSWPSTDPHAPRPLAPPPERPCQRRPPRPTALCPPKKPSPTWRPVSNQPKPRALPQRSPKTSSDRLRCHLSRQRLWDPNLHHANSLNPLARQRLIVIFIRISLNCIMIRLIMVWFSRDLLIK